MAFWRSHHVRAFVAVCALVSVALQLGIAPLYARMAQVRAIAAAQSAAASPSLEIAIAGAICRSGTAHADTGLPRPPVSPPAHDCPICLAAQNAVATCEASPGLTVAQAEFGSVRYLAPPRVSPAARPADAFEARGPPSIG